MVSNNEEMRMVEGGSSLATIIGLSLIGGAITFVIGVLDGLIHPKKC